MNTTRPQVDRIQATWRAEQSRKRTFGHEVYRATPAPTHSLRCGLFHKMEYRPAVTRGPQFSAQTNGPRQARRLQRLVSSLPSVAGPEPSAWTIGASSKLEGCRTLHGCRALPACCCPGSLGSALDRAVTNSGTAPSVQRPIIRWSRVGNAECTVATRPIGPCSRSDCRATESAASRGRAAPRARG
jgi:hypothetical protein